MVGRALEGGHVARARDDDEPSSERPREVPALGERRRAVFVAADDEALDLHAGELLEHRVAVDDHRERRPCHPEPREPEERAPRALDEVGLARELAVQDLERHRLLEDVVLGEVDRAHGTTANLTDQAIVLGENLTDARCPILRFACCAVYYL